MHGALSSTQIVGSRLAGPLGCKDVERYSLALFERVHTGASTALICGPVVRPIVGWWHMDTIWTDVKLLPLLVAPLPL